ncbi:MAG: hypothetical protein K8J08_16890, partial [Thermoanaerobaculia bacterium]|nr:hypothetical protein [Thermoanaerobaculia bacterium]
MHRLSQPFFRPLAQAMLSLVLVLQLPALASAQEPSSSPDPDQLFLDTVHVNLVNFDVFVTDKKG